MVQKFTDIKQLNTPTIITKTADIVEFTVLGKDPDLQDINIAFNPTITDSNHTIFNPISFKLYDSIKDGVKVKFDESKKRINLGTITFIENRENYNPNNSKPNNNKSYYGGQIKQIIGLPIKNSNGPPVKK